MAFAIVRGPCCSSISCDGWLGLRTQSGLAAHLSSHAPRCLACLAAPSLWERAFLEKAYHPGEIFFQEGDPGRTLFVIVEGTVEIAQSTTQREYAYARSDR
jgi:hypothetical protein